MEEYLKDLDVEGRAMFEYVCKGQDMSLFTGLKCFKIKAIVIFANKAMYLLSPCKIRKFLEKCETVSLSIM
jgi:hypothetical protein